MKMREKHFQLCAWLSVLVISLPVIRCSGWKPIIPPGEYYATTPKSTSKYPFVDDDKTENQAPGAFLTVVFSRIDRWNKSGGGQVAETQVKSTLLSPSAGFNQEQNFQQSNKKLDLIYKPTEVPFFPSGEGNPLDSTYQEVLRQSPSSFFSFKTFGPAKSTKTIYYGDLELVKPKLTSDVRYYKPYKQGLKTDVKILKPANFLDNDIGFYQTPKQNIFNDHCSLYKVSFRQDLYYQYIQYKVHMPELKEFTLCLWMRFHNHSHDHSLFSYGAKHHRQAIYMWVSNLNEPAQFNMKVLGQTIFRLNYPIKTYKWYHTCQSWNGHTGEWQVWVNSHRIARGFHNLLVNHPIPGGGVAISGQEHRQFGKGFQEIPYYLRGSGGLQGEITMLQMYKIALTAGKAYNDHSHHHSHYTSTTEEPPELPTEEPSTTTDHPLLENGQLKKHVNVLELAEALKKGQLDTPDLHKHHDHHLPYHQYYEVPLVQPYVSHVAPLALHGNTINIVGLPNHAIFKRNDESKAEEPQTEGPASEEEKKPTEKRIKFVRNVSDKIQVEKIIFSNKTDKMIDEDPMVALPASVTNLTDTSGENSTNLYSDEDKSDESSFGTRVGRRLRRHNPPTSIRFVGDRTVVKTTDIRPPRYFTYGVKKRPNIGKTAQRKVTGNDGKEASKRHVLFEDPYLNFGLTAQDTYQGFGGVPSTGFSYDPFHHFGQDFTELNGGGEQDDEDSHLHDGDSDKKIKKEVELAEGEVRRIMDLCSGCHVDPFRKVAVISWRSTPKKIYSGTLFLKAKSECENF